MAQLRMLAVDIDGTLLSPDHTVTPAVRHAVGRLRELGIAVLPATGRGIGGTRKILQEMAIECDAVCFSGAWTGTIRGTAEDWYQTSAETRIDQDTAIRIADVVKASGIESSWHVDQHWYVEHVGSHTEREIEAVGLTPVLVDSFSTGLPDPHKLMCIGPKDELAGLRDRLAKLAGPTINAVFSQPTHLEILPAGADKANAVFAFAQRSGILPAEICAVGDGYNDLNMIRQAGFGVAMGNAADDIKDAADWITASNGEDGVSVLIDRLIGGGLVLPD